MTDLITSVHNQRVKDAAKLREPRARRMQQRIIIDGVRELRQALHTKLIWEEVFVCDEMLVASDATPLVTQLADASIRITHVTPPVFAKLSFGERHEGLVGIAKTPSVELASLNLGEKPLVAVLEGIEKPGNVGAVLRSADGAGISAVIIADGGTDVFNPNSIRASLGTIFRLPIAAAPSATVHEWLREHGILIFAARVDGAKPYTAANFYSAAAIVLGSESAGLSDAWRGDDVVPIALPMLGTVDSLNVSATAAVLFYEARRQRDTTR